MTRQEANKKLLKELEWFINSCPDQRFGQILCNYFFPKYQTTDPFFVEPTDTLAEVDRAKKCAILDTIAPIGVLSEEELAHAKTLSTLEAVKYIKSIVPSFDLKLSKLYYDLYIGKDNKETEDYVSFETAKLLKEKGFNWDCQYCYIDEDDSDKEQLEVPIGYDAEIDAPTLQMAMKWLREENNKTIIIGVRATDPITGKIDYYYNGIYYVPKNNVSALCFISPTPENGYSTYEEACEAAIRYCLENLI